MRESDILHEAGAFWVGREKDSYTVYRSGATHSVSDSAYAKTEDGLSIAKARCDYLAKRAAEKAAPAMLAALKFISAPQPYGASQEWRDNLQKGRAMVAQAIAAAEGRA